MSSLNPTPLATSSNQCIKCSKSISNQSLLQCEICKLNIHASCLRGYNPNKQSSLNNILFTCDKCSNCSVCSKKVANNHRAILCDCCNSFVHIKCNQLSADDYEKFKNDPNLNFTCLQCNNSIFPYMSLNNDQFSTYVKKGRALDEDLDITLEPSLEQQSLMDKITNKIRSYQFEVDDEENSDFKELTNCKYYSGMLLKRKNSPILIPFQFNI